MASTSFDSENSADSSDSEWLLAINSKQRTLCVGDDGVGGDAKLCFYGGIGGGIDKSSAIRTNSKTEILSGKIGSRWASAMAKVDFMPHLPVGFDAYRVTKTLHLCNSLPYLESEWVTKM